LITFESDLLLHYVDKYFQVVHSFKVKLKDSTTPKVVCINTKV
jgi:hypothetical protein